MMRISEMIRAGKFATAQDLVPAIEAAIRKHFPKSALRVMFQKGFKPSISIFFTVGGSKEEYPNKIEHNDIARHTLHIWGMDDAGNLSDMLQCDPSSGGSVLLKSEDRASVLGSVKVGLRKKKGTPEQIVKHIDNYFGKLLKVIKSNADKIPDNHKALLKSIKL